MGERRKALVTGSSSGIGAATAVRLARAGFDVAVNYNSKRDAAVEVAAACQAEGADTLVLGGDVSQEADVVAMMAAATERWGRLDALCSNAGTSIETPPKRFHEIEVDDWDRVFAVNVRGLFLTAKHAHPLLMAADTPAMVITASIVGLRPGAQPLPYSASKAAVISMTQTLAGALGPKVRVNAIAPGWMEGDWMRWMLKDKYDQLMERRARATPLGRCVTVEDIAETVLGLIDHMPFTTGETVVIDGGFARTT